MGKAMNEESTEDANAGSLDSLCGRPMESGIFLRLAAGIAAQLEDLHRRNVIHLNISPHTISIDTETGTVTIEEGNLLNAPPGGIPQRVPDEMLPYMSPEQTGRMNRAVDHRTDLYSLGVTLYRMLTGTLPFEAADALEWVHCHIARSPRSPRELVADIPPILSDMVMKLLVKNAEERYQTAAGLRFDLEKCLEGWQAGKEIEGFPLAKWDIPDRLLIPRKLYGREREVDILLRGFNRVARSGTPEIVMVAGHSGIGKTSLVRDLWQPVFGERGYFISGKFDRNRRAIPYSKAPDLFRELSQQILAESEERVADWQRRIQEAVGVNGQLIVDVIPEVELVIGKQPPVPELPLTESRNRFSMVFRQFSAVFAKKEHPLVVFLDDLQWIDFPGLQLLAYIITHPDTRYLFLIGTYRDNEVDPSHPLLSTLADIRRSGTPLQTIDLSPLSPTDIGHLLADTFHTDPRRVGPLTSLVYEKTGGSPFFVGQFLRALADEKLVEFDREKRRWHWDIVRIREKGYTENVADLMVEKLKKLSNCTQQQIRVAACIGNRFDLHTLSVIGSLPAEETAVSLAEGVREGLLLRRNGDYSFLHDHIQEAAYSHVPERDLPGLHLRIGRLLLANTPENRIEESIFDVVNHFNLGAALITAQEERIHIAGLNLRAAKKAKSATAYRTAVDYLAAGVALLPSDQWEQQHDLAFALHLELAECERLSGAFAEAAGYFPVLLRHARTRIEKAAVYRVKIDTHNIKGEGGDAIESALACLRMLGIDMPAHPADAEVQKAYETIWSSLGDRRIDELIDLPPMTDPDKQAAMEILSRLYIPAYYSDNNLFFLHICYGVNLSLQYGNAAASTYAYGWFGVLLATVFSRPRDGQGFARLAYDLMERYRFLAYKAPVNMFLKFVAYWSETLDKMIEYSRAMLESGVSTGDVAAACFSFSETLLGMISRGDRLSEVHNEAERGFDFVRRAGFSDVIDLITGLDRFALSMRGLTRHLSTFDDDRFSEAEFEARLPEDRMPTLVFFYHTVKLMARFFSGDLDAALASGKKSRALLWAGLFSVQSHYFYFYYALTLAALLDRFSPGERQEALGVLATHEGQLREWARNCPATFHNAHSLVCAEIARITGKELEAMRLYEEAIKSARDNGFVQNEALANEVAARFYRERGFEKIASTYLREARSCYLRWEADGKVKQLDERYPWLREEEPAATPIGQVDAITVVKGTQAISGEILLSNLLNRLMKIVLENGGAQRGCLLLVRGDDLSSAARARVEGEEIKVLQEVSVPLPSVLPLSIINYVRRTRQMVILDDASARHMFSSDEYIVENKPVSVLCLPILRQAHLTGLLYLENDLVRGAFTASRIAVLEVLAAQAAISLENSTLYASLQKAHEELEQRVTARTEELSRANAKLQELDRLKSMFIASMSHELRTPLNSMIGFSSLLLEEWFGTLNEEQKENLSIVLRSAKHLLNLINDVIDVSKVEAGKVETMVEEFDVYDPVSEAVTTMAKDIRDKGLALKFEMSHCRMRTDRRRLLQCVLNLLGNAAKFTEKGGSILVVARQVQDFQLEEVEPRTTNIEPDKNFVEIFVEDTGVGIKEEDLPKLFNPFARIESPIKAPGTGLGLYLTKKLTTELLKGRISCRSKYGEGSRFTLRMPVKI